MAKWDDLPLDIWKKIAESIEFYEDFCVFGEVCSEWRKAMKIAKPSIQIPWLLLAEPPRTSSSQQRRLYNFYNRKVHPIELPKPSTTRGQTMQTMHGLTEDDEGDRRYFSSRGWLICVTQIGLNITLIHPISKQVIQPPGFPEDFITGSWPNYEWNVESYLCLFAKFVLSENPSASTHSDEFVLTMIFPWNTSLVFWKSGDKEWTMLEVYSQFLDVTFYRGEFYAVEQSGKIIAVGNSSPPSIPRLVADLKFMCKYSNSSYLVESAGKLLYVYRKLVDSEEFTTVELHYFKVWEINVDTGEVKAVTSLGDRALFLGYNSSFSVKARPPICRPNCIYYTDNYYHNYLLIDEIKKCDMGIYDISLDRKIGEFYQGPSCLSKSTLPLWVEFSY